MLSEPSEPLSSCSSHFFISCSSKAFASSLYVCLRHRFDLAYSHRQAPIPPIRRTVTYILTALISRLTLLVVGVWWIPVEHVTRKRYERLSILQNSVYSDQVTGHCDILFRRTAGQQEAWAPKPGDLIVSNWVSWIEILWLAFRCAEAVIRCFEAM